MSEAALPMDALPTDADGDDAAGPEARGRRRSARWPWYVLLLVVTLLPLPFGGMRPWAWSLAGLLAGAALIGWAVLGLRDRAPMAWRAALWGPVALFAIVVAWILVQTIVPVPASIANPLWQLAGETLGTPLTGRISAAPEAGLVLLMRLLTNAAIFWLALQYGRDRDRAAQALQWLVIASALYAIYGLINFVAGNHYLLLVPRGAYPDDITGTFVNRNSYATFAGVTLLAAVTMAVRAFRARWRVGDPSLSHGGRVMEAFAGWTAIHATAAVIIAMAWLQSHSRMGFAATMLGLLVLLLLFRLGGVLKGRLIWLGFAAAAIGGLLFVSGGQLLSRLGGTTNFDRAPLFDDVRSMIASTPWLGSGYGSFPGVFAMYRKPTLLSSLDVTQAHDTYLELLAELGIPGASLLILAVLWLAVLCAIGTFRRTRDQAFPALGVAATVLVAVHAITDFSLQIPGMVTAYMMVLGVAVAQSWSHETRRASIKFDA